MEPPSLRLLVLRGPREGETLEFRPGSAIRLGRVVRGNTFSIKDPGISTKHLSILTESGKWVLRDLDSSNGTVLDGSKVPPHTPFNINDGSTIEIGELTSILVTFLHETASAAAPVVKPGGRGRRGKALTQSIDETGASAVNESGNVGRPASTRVTRRNLKNKVGDLGAPEPVNTRVTRNSKNQRGAIEISDSGAPEERAEEPKNTRVTRNSKNKTNVIKISDSDAPVEEPKVTRSLKSKRNEIEISDSRIGSLDAPEEKVEEPKITRVTRNLKNKQNVVETSDSGIGNLDAADEKVEEPRVTRNSNNEQSVIGGSPQNSNLELGVENVEKKNTSGGAKNVDGTEKEKLNGDENLPDLEKLSLGEWFDFLEVHLPKEVTEEMFDSMRQNAERLREYIIMMQKNHQVEVPVAKFLKACGLLTRTPAEIRKASEELKVSPCSNDSSTSSCISNVHNTQCGFLDCTERSRLESLHNSDKPSKVDESLSSWLKPASLILEERNKRMQIAYNHIRKTPRPIIGMVAAHCSEEDSQVPPPKWWDDNGIPNSTNKYKEDQKVSWHATPFEERLEKALSGRCHPK